MNIEASNDAKRIPPKTPKISLPNKNAGTNKATPRTAIAIEAKTSLSTNSLIINNNAAIPHRTAVT